MSLFGYTTVGSSTGGCGHRHRSLEAAQSCLSAARRHFFRVGLRSGRHVAEVAPGDVLEEPRVPSVGIPSVLEDLLDHELGEWRMLCATVILNRAGARPADPYEILGVWSRPERLATSGHRLERFLEVGTPRRRSDSGRARNLRGFSAWWFRCGWLRAKRWLPSATRLATEAERWLDLYSIDAYRILVCREEIKTNDHALRAIQNTLTQ